MRKAVSDCPPTLLESLPVTGERIAHLRQLYGWTQKDLSGVAGLSIHYVRSVERAQMVETWVLWKITEAMKVHFWTLWVGPKRWARLVAVRELQVGWNPETKKPRTKQAGAGVELWEEGD